MVGPSREWPSEAQGQLNAADDDAGSSATDPADESTADLAADARRLTGEAARFFRSQEIRSGAEAAIRAGDLARRAGRGDLLAEAALVVSGVQDEMLDTAIESLSREALALVPKRDLTTRARLHGQLAVALYHRGLLNEAALSTDQALELATAARDPRATAAALHARQMIVQGLFRPTELIELGDRMLELATGSDSSQDEMLARIWRIDGFMQLGTPQLALREVDSLDVLAARTDDPLIAWHGLRSRAGVNMAVGRFDEAERYAAMARDRLSRVDASFAIPQFYAQQVMISLDRGRLPPEFDAIRTIAAGGPPLIRATLGYLELVCGRRTDARASFEATKARLADARRDETWPPTIAPMIVLAVAFDDVSVADALHRELLPHDGLVIAGAIASPGPIAYFLGLVELHMGLLDEAIARFEAAAALAARGDLGPALTRIRVAMADGLARRARAGDRQQAANLAAMAAADARRLGMARVLAEAAELERRWGRSPLQLSPREREIAGEVAAGRSNREVAARLVLSERTVETHVQNILAKLGFHSRAQVAAWAVSVGLAEHEG